MERRALALAMRNLLRSLLSYQNHECETMLDGRPPPRCGPRFIAIHQGARRNEQEGSYEITVAISVTVSLRVNGPWDKLGVKEINDATTGIEKLISDIIATVVKNQETLRVNANTLYGSTYPGFVECLQYVTDGPIVPRSPGWFHGEDGDEDAGVSCEIKFDRAKVIRDIPNAGI